MEWYHGKRNRKTPISPNVMEWYHGKRNRKTPIFLRKISWNGIMVKGIEKHRSLIDPFSTWDRLETLESEVYKRQILTSKVNPALKDDLTYDIT